MNQFAMFLGVVYYEFRMQIQRKAFWITFLALGLLFSGIRDAFMHSIFILLLAPNELFRPSEAVTTAKVVVFWTRYVNSFLPLAVGILLADRLPRDHRTKVDELFNALPSALSTRLIGKYIGTFLATIIPLLIFYGIGIGCILYQSHDLHVIPFSLLTFAAIALPGLAFISAFSLACPAIIWVPLYQFLFIGYWFWGNLLGPRVGIPTLSVTILTPIGGYMTNGFFGGDAFPIENATALQGVESLSLLLGIAGLVMVVLWWYMRWQQERQ